MKLEKYSLFNDTKYMYVCEQLDVRGIAFVQQFPKENSS